MVFSMKCPACGLMQMSGPTCKSCSRPLGGPAPRPSPPQYLTIAGPVQQHEKIGGWLILLAIGLILAPLRVLVFLGKDFVPIFTTKTWSVLTTPGTGAYHPLWAPILMFEGVGNTALIVFSVIVAIYFFQKRRIVPKLMIALLLANVFFVGTDYFVANLIPAVGSQKDVESMGEFARVVIACVIWVPYFLVSKRVKATFVH